MKNKILMICTKISIALFFGFMSLFVYLWIFNPNPISGEPPMHWHHISLGQDVNLSASGVESHESLLFFNGPMPNDTTMFGSNVKETFYEGWGIYFKLINNTAMKITWWTLMISLWYPIIIFAILPTIFMIKKLRNRKSVLTQKATVEK
jgi:hypothetical protein